MTYGLDGIAVSSTGSYQAVGSPIETSAEGVSGSFKVVEKVECVLCLTQADTLQALSPDHDNKLCLGDGCNILYRKCDTEKLKEHRKVTCSPYMKQFIYDDWDSDDVSVFEILIEGCGVDYWLCGNVEPHRAMDCGMCNTHHRACCPHYDDSISDSQSGSGRQQGNGSSLQDNGNGGTCATCARISGTCSDCTDAQEANAGNGGGGAPPSNGGCTTVEECVNTNCELTPPCTTSTCVREIRV